MHAVWCLQSAESYYKEGGEVVSAMDLALRQVTDKLARDDIMTLQDLTAYHQHLFNTTTQQAELTLVKGVYRYFFAYLHWIDRSLPCEMKCM